MVRARWGSAWENPAFLAFQRGCARLTLVTPTCNPSSARFAPNLGITCGEVAKAFPLTCRKSNGIVAPGNSSVTATREGYGCTVLGFRSRPQL